MIWLGRPASQGGGIEPSNDSHRGQSKFGQAVLLRRGVPLKGDRGSERFGGRSEGCPTFGIGGRTKSGAVLKFPQGGPGKPSNVWHTPLRLFAELEYQTR